jgi:hypothetical protein
MYVSAVPGAALLRPQSYEIISAEEWVVHSWSVWKFNWLGTEEEFNGITEISFTFNFGEVDEVVVNIRRYFLKGSEVVLILDHRDIPEEAHSAKVEGISGGVPFSADQPAFMWRRRP